MQAEDTPTLIMRRRRQMLVHSYIYYQLDDNLVSDNTWQIWANELASLQELHGYQLGDESDGWFKDWRGDTGIHLPTPAWVKSKALQLMDYKP